MFSGLQERVCGSHLIVHTDSDWVCEQPEVDQWYGSEKRVTLDSTQFYFANFSKSEQC